MSRKLNKKSSQISHSHPLNSLDMFQNFLPNCLLQLKRCWTKRTSLNDNTRAMLLYFIQTFPPCVSVQPIAGAGQDSGHDQAWQTTPLFNL